MKFVSVYNNSLGEYFFRPYDSGYDWSKCVFTSKELNEKKAKGVTVHKEGIQLICY
jgi:hypothetical protein